LIQKAVPPVDLNSIKIIENTEVLYEEAKCNNCPENTSKSSYDTFKHVVKAEVYNNELSYGTKSKQAAKETSKDSEEENHKNIE